MAAPTIDAPARTFAPIQQVIGREVHGERAAVKLECGHVTDLEALHLVVATSCPACRPIEVIR